MWPSFSWGIVDGILAGPGFESGSFLGKAVTTVQSRNDTKVLDLGSNKVKLDQQIKSTEMGG